MKIVPSIILILVCSCKSVGDQTCEKHTTANSEKNNLRIIVPQRVEEYLKSNLTNWLLPDTSDYNRIWWDFNDKEQIPYYVTTDLNDDNISDYAFILKNSQFIKFIIIIDSGKNLTHWIDEEFQESYQGKADGIQYGLNILPPGQIDCMIKSEEASTILKSNGIVLLKFEFKSRIYYWSDDTIKVIPINEDKHLKA